MRKSIMGIEEAKENIRSFMGHNLKISVNKGRKRVVKYDGCIGGVYPAVFTLQIAGDKHLSMLSCSYSDFICGDIVIVRKA